MSGPPLPPWTLADAEATYNIAHWGGGHFSVNPAGHVVVRPDPDAPHPGIDLHALACHLPTQGLALPVLVRFSGILHQRVAALCAAFDRARRACGYHGRYTAVYPIKVNQQAAVVDALLAGGGDRLGLEAGSRPELLAVLARSRAGGLVVCNGYKDREFIRLALLGRRLGLDVHIVLERRSELELVIEEAAASGLPPRLGLRLRLASLGTGKWQNTGGEKAKFGLAAGDLLRVVERLRGAGLLGALRMLHFHMGSQIANIHDIRNGLGEAARLYAELTRLGAPIQTVNVGGGLGVDYEGTRSRSFCSMNYSLDEYAGNIVQALAEVCQAHGLRHPDIVSESGRALTAHHAVLLTQVTEVEAAPGMDPPAAVAGSEPGILQDLWRTWEGIADRPPLELYHDAARALAEVQSQFTHGLLTLAERARAEGLHFAILRCLRGRLSPAVRAHREALDELNEKLADKYFCNFSLFQSMPDHWAIDQVFPVLPLSRLDERPERRAVLEDITCDSDGRVDSYVDGAGLETTLPLHTPRPGEPYRLGVFLVGAYQEILGDLHNLFGDTHAVQVETDDAPPGWRLTDIQRGDTVAEVLRFVRFDPAQLLATLRGRIEALGLDAGETARFVATLERGLAGYTYLED